MFDCAKRIAPLIRELAVFITGSLRQSRLLGPSCPLRWSIKRDFKAGFGKAT